MALVLVAFAHKPLGMSGPADAAAYVLPDGSPQVICTTAEDGGASDRVLHATICDACLICGSILVPAPAALKAPAPIASIALALPRAAPILTHSAWPHSPANPARRSFYSNPFNSRTGCVPATHVHEGNPC